MAGAHEVPDREDAERRLVDRLRAGADGSKTRSMDWLETYRSRSVVVDLGVRLYERDREAAGTLLGSALALRLFLFFLPLMLVMIGVAGLLGRYAAVDELPDNIGLSASVAAEINWAFQQSTTTTWASIALGLFFMATTGRSLTRALVLSSALSWQLGGHQRTRVRVIGIVVGLMVSAALIWAIWNRVRSGTGLALASLSFGGVVVAYVILWSLMYLSLPRATTDPGAALPGATLVAAVLGGLQAVTSLYGTEAVADKSALYGAVGITVAFLGWFFLLGRVISFAFSLNAVLFERFGSVSRVLFGLPLLRLLPRRSRAFARYFDLVEDGGPTVSADAGAPPGEEAGPVS